LIPTSSRDLPRGVQHKIESSKNYDRWTYMPEKRAAMTKWNEFVTTLLAIKKRAIAA
jgi:hypothetical protein